MASVQYLQMSVLIIVQPLDVLHEALGGKADQTPLLSIVHLSQTVEHQSWGDRLTSLVMIFL